MKSVKIKSGTVAVLFALILTATGLIHQTYFVPNQSNVPASETINSADYPLQVKYIDVGQGDSELIILPNDKIILIDAGDKGKSSKLFHELKTAKIKKIDYLIATHPHADHIGEMKKVVEDYDIGDIYMPRADQDTKTYLALLETISKKGLKINAAKAGVVVFEEAGLKAEFLAPNSDSYEELNNYSAVLKLTYQNTRFLFVGDAEALSEKEMISAGFDLCAEVLKVGHHGSSSSTSLDFLNAVNPSVAIISCGKDNSYGHPHEETLEKLNDKQIQVLRTNKMGTITLYSSGEKTIAVTEKGE